ncbi:MAG: hypothetical protein ACYC6W_09670 [Nitrosotalea sp.]
MFSGITLYSCQDLPDKSILTEKFKDGKITNEIDDLNTRKKRNLPSILRDAQIKRDRIIGVIDYFYQDRVSNQIAYSDIHSTNAFILSPDDKILVILGIGSDAPFVKGIISKIIDDSQTDVQFFSNLEIPPEKMLKIGLKVRDSHKKNWCERPRFSHDAGAYKGHVFHDYANGDFNCIFETKEFNDEYEYTTGFSPIIKYFMCNNLDPNISTKPKTMRFKHEGQISTSKHYGFQDWQDFVFNLLLPIIKST